MTGASMSAAGARTHKSLKMVTVSARSISGPEASTIGNNDLCVLAPAALIDAPVIWTSLDDHRVRGAYTYGANTVAGELTFDDDDQLVDFFSDDRNAVSADGTTFTPQRWSTPISAYRDLGSARLGTMGEGHWHAADGEFAYLEFDLDDITYNAADLDHPTAVSGT